MITLTQTEQEAFDTVVAHLNAMTQRSMTDTGFCMYRLGYVPTGNRCAIGALIPDAEYRNVLDSSGTVTGLVSDHLLNTGGIRLDLLAELQRCHDDGTYWDFLENQSKRAGDVYMGPVAFNELGRAELARIARAYGLVSE